MPLMRINYYIYAEDEKAGSVLSMYPHLPKIAKYFSSKWFWRCCSEKYDGQIIIWDEVWRRVGVGNVYNAWYHTNESAEYKQTD